MITPARSSRRSASGTISAITAVMTVAIAVSAGAAQPLRDPGRPKIRSTPVQPVGFSHPQNEQVSYDVGCGVEVSCGCEGPCDCDAGGPYGGEVGCGVGAAMEHLGSFDPGCGFEVGCGIESSDCFDPSFASCDSCDACGDCDGGCDQCCGVSSIPVALPLFRVNWNRFSFFAGVNAFTGPLNHADNGGAARRGSGSFGFYEGVNEGRSLRQLMNWDMAAQLGIRFIQANLSDAAFSAEARQQVFVTGGLFRRVDYGLQYGTVLDYINEDWYYQSDLLQSRSEASWKFVGPHVLGIQYMTSLNDDVSGTLTRNDAGGPFRSNVRIEGVDQYRFFYRHLTANGGNWKVFGGFTDDDDGLVGGDATVPLRQRLSASVGFVYKIPSESPANFGYQNEAWNLSMGLVYQPGGPKGCGRYCRPLFDVADNGTFMVDGN